MAAKDFLSAVSVKLAPDWGRRELANLIRDNELSRTPTTLEEYSTWFSALAHENSLRQNSKAPGIFTNLRGRSDEPGNSTGSSSTLYACPYRDPTEEKHHWKPEDCSFLEYVITGKSKRTLWKPPTKEACEEIKARLAYRR